MKVTDAMVLAAMTALDAHRWKSMGLGTTECECGAILGDPDSISLAGFPGDLAYRAHLARAVLEAALA